MRDKQTAKNQLINESTKLRQRSAKSEKAETRHKKAEEALRESEETYRQLTESISDVFFEMDKDLRCTYWNKASEKITGISAKDAIGKSLLELFPDIPFTRKTKRVYLDVLITQQPQTFINEYLFGGKDFFFDINVYPSKHGLSVFAKDITERMQAEEELREKEEFNFALFQHNPIQTIVVDRGGRVIKVNMAKRESGDRLPNIGDVMYKDYAAKHEIDMQAELMECIRSDKKKKFPAMKYGDKFLDITIASFPQGAIITSLDITERKRAEEELEDIFNLSPDMIAVCDTEGKFLKANPSWEKVLGYTTREVLDLGWTKLVHPDDVEKTNKEIEKQLKVSPIINFINRFKCKDGSYKLLEWQATYAKEGIVHATARDITDRKKAEEALRASEGKYRSLFDNMLEGFAYCKIIVDKNNKPVDFEYIEVNDAFEKLTGLTKEQVTGKRVTEAIPDIKKTNPEVFKIYGKVALTGKPTHFDIYFKPIKRWLSISVYCPKRGYFVAIFENITERKQAEEEIKNSQLQLRNLTAHLQSVREEERTLIAREMHDELGQALTAMKMDLSWLDKKLPKDQKPLFKKIKSMSKLADATLQTVKKISTDLRPGLLDDLGLTAAIEWQAEEFQTRTGIKCEITVDPEDIILDKDRSTAIFRIFQETLTNVARHAKATKVKVSLKEKAGKIELKVRDNGKGITEKQVSDPKSFGLIGIKERAYYLDGKVVIKGLQDKGTALTIRIPLPKKGKTR